MTSVGREDDLDDENYQIREVYAVYGLASYYSQVMEKGVVNTLTVQATGTIPSGPKRELEYDKNFDRYARMTLGRLLIEFETTFPVEIKIIQALREALPLRNFVAHKFFWERAAAFMSFTGREGMLTELLEARDAFAATDKLVEELCRSIMVSFGISEEQLEAYIEKSLAEHRAQSRTTD